MKKSIKYLLIILAVVLVLGAAVLVLVLTDPNRGAAEEESSNASADTISLVSKEAADVASMEISFRDDADGSYTLLPQEASDGDEPVFTIKGLETISLKTSALKSVASFGHSLTATKDLGALENKAEYGLDNPQISVKVTFTDGSTFAYDVGDETPNGGYYIKTADSDNLYVSTLGANLLKKKLELVDTTILSITAPQTEEEAAAGTAATNVFNTLKFSGANFAEPIEIVNEPDSTIMSTYLIKKPRELGCNDENVGKITTSLESLSASSVAAVYPDEAVLKEYGFENPVCVLEFTANDTEHHTLRTGNRTDAGTYVMVDDVQVVYVVDNATASGWADVTLHNLRSVFLALPYIDNVEKVEIKTADVSHTFTLSRTLDEEKSTEDDPSYILTVKGTAGQDLTIDTFRKFYQVAIGVQLLMRQKKKPEGKPYLTLTYRYYDSGEADVVEFYESKESDRTYLAVVNGAVDGVVKKTTLESLLSNAKDMENDVNVGA